MKIKRFLSLALCLLMALSLAVPALAVDDRDENYTVEDNGDHKDGTGSNVEITIEAADVTQGSGSIDENGWVTMTVPATIPILFKAATDKTGKNTVVPTNWTITNNDPNTGVHISSMELVGQDGWQVAGKTTDMKAQAKNTKMIKFTAGFDGNDYLIAGDADAESAKVEGIEADKLVIPATESKTFVFGVERTVFSEASQVTAYQFNITFDWN